MGVLCGHKDIINCLATLSNSPILASGSWDKSIKIWNIENREIVCTLTLLHHSEGISAMYFMQTRVLVSGSLDHSLMVWNIEHKNSNIYTQRT